MFQARTRSLVATALVAGAFVFGTWFGRNTGAPAALAAEAAPEPKPTPQELYELRIYTAAPDKLDALHARFRDHTLRLFKKHEIKSIGYWTGVDDGQRHKLYYLLAYPDREARDRRLVNGIAKDPEFLKAVAESEKAGKLTSATESVLLAPTDYSPLK